MTTFKIAAAPSPIPASTADNASARGAQSSPSLASSLGISRHGQRQRAIAQQLLSRSTPARPPAISLLSSRGGGGGRSGSISPKEGESENRTLAQPQSPSPSSSALVPCTPVVGRISRVGDGGQCRQNSVSSTATIAIITSNNDRCE